MHYATVWKIEKGESPLMSDHVFALSRALDVHPAVLLGLLPDTPHELLTEKNRIPLLEHAEAAKLAKNDVSLDKLKAEKFLPSTGEETDMAFAIRIQDDSMEPEFRRGDIVVLEPNKPRKPGCFVAAVRGDGNLVFHKYRERGTDDSGVLFELVPLNNDYPTLDSRRDELVLIGVLEEHRKRY